MSARDTDGLAVTSLNLSLPPSCIAFSPIHHDHLIIGTYFLEQSSDDNTQKEVQAEPQTRKGSLILFRLVNGTLNELQTIPTPSGILDAAFSPHDPSILCAATSTGSLLFYRLAPSSTNSSLTLIPQHTLQPFPTSILILDLEHHPTNPSVIGTTLSTGATVLITTSAFSSAPEVTEIHSHALEAWTLAFSPCGNYIYSGADDASLSLTQLSSPTPSSFDLEAAPGTTLTDRRTHGAGVTAILPLRSSAEAHTLLTGSYDDHIRVLTMRPGRRAEVHAELDLGGGVWRLHLILCSTHGSGRTWTLLASCMYAGARVVRVHCEDWESLNGWTIEVLQKFEAHKSMNYGSDVQPVEGETKGKRTAVTSSFYDKLVCVWEVDASCMHKSGPGVDRTVDHG
ncbi:WD40 repeat-like protein [Myriangium duriaei CBS 260.36]|uniref:methylated diphthine methylhydrolase n=1 Tax=Myriangium duriaei CBS 260.36 TaxID=1168546 RepID=A0A9P4J374_9PEZI|nr:WD40 repeat-like protein [Myriangium duriaei CBS 260.36]